MTPSISIIIPTYKPNNYIIDCIASIAKQTLDLSQFEVILILNGDKEPFYSQLKKVTSELKCSVNIFYSERASVSSARNIGIESAKGEYITFLDDDDIISKTYLQELLEKAKSNTIVISNVKTFEKNINKTSNDYLTKCFNKSIYRKRKTQFNTRSYFSTSCAKIIPLRVIKDRRFNPEFKIGEDCIFMALISDKIKSIDTTSLDATYYRRIRNSSASQTRVPQNEMTMSFKAFKEYISIYFRKPFHYNILFFSTRIASTIQWFIISILQIKKLKK